MEMIQVGIVGAGAIGSALAKAIEQKFSDYACLAYVVDTNPSQIERLKTKVRSPFKSVPLDELVRSSHFIIEAASVEASKELIPLALKANKDILVLSVGGMLKIENLSDLVKKSKAQIYIPSGGVAGVDGVLGSKSGEIQSVQI